MWQNVFRAVRLLTHYFKEHARAAGLTQGDVPAAESIVDRLHQDILPSIAIMPVKSCLASVSIGLSAESHSSRGCL
jgi:hypothetical protein